MQLQNTGNVACYLAMKTRYWLNWLRTYTSAKNWVHGWFWLNLRRQAKREKLDTLLKNGETKWLWQSVTYLGMHSQTFLFVFSVIYFLFVMALCVLSVTTTMCVMYLDSRAHNDPVIAMPDWVCISRLYNLRFSTSDVNMTFSTPIPRHFVQHQTF